MSTKSTNPENLVKIGLFVKMGQTDGQTPDHCNDCIFALVDAASLLLLKKTVHNRCL